MRLSIVTVSALAAAVTAFPAVQSEARQTSDTNAGFFPNKEFNAADQYVDVRKGSGHEFKAPRKTDIRGPCPGLNAAANHGFTSRTGVNDHRDTTEGLFQAFSLGKDFSNILFIFSVFNSGSLLDLAWSIGGPMPSNTVGGLLGKGKGLSNSHNHYEGDSSTGRGDAYLHQGDAHSLNMGNFKDILHHAGKKDNFDFPSMRLHNVYSHEYSIKHNPYTFYGINFFITPIAHEFVTAFMSNHSKNDIGGTLSKKVLKTFFSVKDNADGSMTWVKGHDRIPDNWYKRPTSNPYGVNAAFGDLAKTIALYPAIGDIGGNLGKPNSFAGVEVEDLTGGVFRTSTLLEKNNLACFALQALVFGTPGVASALESKATAFLQKSASTLGGAYKKLSCPQINKLQMKHFKKYPGYGYTPPEQPATPY